MPFLTRDAGQLATPIPGVGISRKLVLILCTTIPAAVLLDLIMGAMHCTRRHRNKVAVAEKEKDEGRRWPHQPLPVPRVFASVPAQGLPRGKSRFAEALGEPLRRDGVRHGPRRVFDGEGLWPHSAGEYIHAGAVQFDAGNMPQRHGPVAEGLRLWHEQLLNLHL